MIIKQKTMASLCLSIFIGLGANAQTSSFNANAIPITGTDNSGYGFGVLGQTNAGKNNTALGNYALFTNNVSRKSADYNTAVGWYAMYKNDSGYKNAALGAQALYNNTGGQSNSAFGASALQYNSLGYGNSANGFAALFSNTTGNHNTAIGKWAMYTVTTGGHNTGLGYYANVQFDTSNYATAIGSGSIVNLSNKIKLGDGNVLIVEGQVPYSVTSDGRFKTNVKEDDVKGLAFILKLRPVVYNFETRKFQEFLTQNMSEEAKKEYLAGDFNKSTAVRQSGFIAQEVEQAASEAGYNFNGIHKPEHAADNYSLAYSQFVVPLVKAVQEQQQMIDQQQQVNETLAATVAAQQKQIEELKKMVASIAGQPVNNDNNTKLVMEEISVYPNPSKGTFMVNTKTIDTGVLEVMDVAGKKVQTTELKKNTFTYAVDLTGFAKGTYLVNITSNGKTITKKLIVE